VGGAGGLPLLERSLPTAVMNVQLSSSKDLPLGAECDAFDALVGHVFPRSVLLVYVGCDAFDALACSVLAWV